MVTQGDIILLDVGPSVGHEQAGRRPALVVSSTSFTTLTYGMDWVVPISSVIKDVPLHLDLPKECKTKGQVLCHQIKTIDLRARNVTRLEQVSPIFLQQVLHYIQLITQP